jgi:hypothetical protein
LLSSHLSLTLTLALRLLPRHPSLALALLLSPLTPGALWSS